MRGHRDVHQHDVRVQRLGELDRLLAVLGATDDVEALVIGEDGLERAREEEVVVGDEDPDGVHPEQHDCRPGGAATLAHRGSTRRSRGERGAAAARGWAVSASETEAVATLPAPAPHPTSRQMYGATSRGSTLRLSRRRSFATRSPTG